MNLPRLLRVFSIFACCLVYAVCRADALSMGYRNLPQEDGGSTSVFYPTLAAESTVSRGPFELSWAMDAAPHTGNRKLIVISHGSGGSPWVHADLARTLVQHGFVVAIPQHAADNYLDPSEPGPSSWKKRPREVSDAIDRVGANPELASQLRLDSVGVFGGSAGGHTALSLAGGEWSPSRFRDHCLAHIAEDFSSCVGFLTLLRGDWFDSLKLWAARLVIRFRFDDSVLQRYTDDRIRAAVAMVPFAADFLPASLREPVVPLGLIIAERDINQIPAFHVEAVLSACESRCEVIVRMPEAGHGAMLSPVPPLEPRSPAEHLLGDPPAFDRAKAIPELNGAIAKFFVQKLTAQ